MSYECQADECVLVISTDEAQAQRRIDPVLAKVRLQGNGAWSALHDRTSQSCDMLNPTFWLNWISQTLNFVILKICYKNHYDSIVFGTQVCTLTTSHAMKTDRPSVIWPKKKKKTIYNRDVRFDKPSYLLTWYNYETLWRWNPPPNVLMTSLILLCVIKR